MTPAQFAIAVVALIKSLEQLTAAVQGHAIVSAAAFGAAVRGQLPIDPTWVNQMVKDAATMFGQSAKVFFPYNKAGGELKGQGDVWADPNIFGTVAAAGAPAPAPTSSVPPLPTPAAVIGQVASTLPSLLGLAAGAA